jgi:hypothetical protein
LKRWKRLSAWVFILGFSLSLTITTGCSDDPVDPSTCESYVATNLIIMNPLAPAPGDTTLLTVQAMGEGCNNTANYTWMVDGGELVEETGITVRWVAPMDCGSYIIRCRATLSGASPDTAQTLALIRNVDYLNTGKVVSMRPSLTDNSLCFIAEDGNVGPRNRNFLGYAVFDRSPAGDITRLTYTGDSDDEGGIEFDFTEMNQVIYGSFITDYFDALRQQRMNVFKFPRGGVRVNASNDRGGAGALRKNMHRYPKTNAMGDKAVWKFQFAGSADDGTEDLFNIAYWDETAGSGHWYTITQSHDSSTAIIGPDTVMIHRYYNNIRPMFTPDEDNILYFVDTTSFYEPCIIPMVDGSPDTLQRRAMIYEDTGIFEQAGVFINEGTVFQWIPGQDVLTFVSGGRVVFFYYSSETVAIVNDLTSVREIVWAPDGSQLAAVNDVGVYLVGSGGGVSPDPVYVKERSTDDLRGINWNNDMAEPKLTFRLVRKGKSDVDSWSAMVIVDLNMGLHAYASEPVPWHSSREPNLPDYTWLRGIFDEDGIGIYMPFPIIDETNYPGKDIVLFYSHE